MKKITIDNIAAALAPLYSEVDTDKVREVLLDVYAARCLVFHEGHLDLEAIGRHAEATFAMLLDLIAHRLGQLTHRAGLPHFGASTP